ncbi:hypothetical protein QJQ45_010983 [Haematococcus lacustris]|nr:hypothetical protein QJQ45_010983 [Haematococcus lacustris]
MSPLGPRRRAGLAQARAIRAKLSLTELSALGTALATPQQSSKDASTWGHKRPRTCLERGAQQQLSMDQQQLQDGQHQLALDQLQLNGAQHQLSLDQQELQGAQHQLSLDQQQLQGAQHHLALDQQQLQDARLQLTVDQQQLQDAKRRVNLNEDAKRRVKLNENAKRRVKLNEQMPSYIWHHFVAHHQQENGDHGRVVMSCDGSERLTVERPTEIQSDHWHHENVGIFDRDEYREETVYVLTDGKDQSAAVTQAALHQVLDYLQGEQCMVMKQLCMWSDGCAAQFKGTPALQLHRRMAMRYKVSVWWSYGATSHFKGRHDSEGGVFKHSMAARVLAEHPVLSAECKAQQLAGVHNVECVVHAAQLAASVAHQTRGSVQRRWCLVLKDEELLLVQAQLVLGILQLLLVHSQLVLGTLQLLLVHSQLVLGILQLLLVQAQLVLGILQLLLVHSQLVLGTLQLLLVHA